VKKKTTAAKPATGSKGTQSSRASTSSTESPSKWIRIERPLPLPSYVKEAVQLLNDAGHVAYIVGGSVRDFLLGNESKDHDVATSASPDELCELFPRAVTVGKAFGVIKVPINVSDTDAPVLLEIATFREDLEYQNHRHPKGVRFSGPIEDALRRDFTINGLFYDPKTSRILDTVQGMQDLKEGVIRAIGDPSIRFKEDALRLLRAVRFAARLGFGIEPDTVLAIQERAKLITKVSSERIRDELTLMWTGPRPAEALEMLSHLGLLVQVLPEIEALKSAPLSTWVHMVKAMRTLAAQNPKRSATLTWATLLLEVARAPANTVPGGQLAREIATRFKMPGDEVERIGKLVEEYGKFRDVFKMRESTLQRFLRESGFEEMLALHKIEALVADGNLAYYEFCHSRYETLRSSPLADAHKLVDGKDLIQLGLSPGPEFSEILRVIEDLAMEKRLGSKDEALEYVVKNFVK
jgi:poly(A) polymerase